MSDAIELLTEIVSIPSVSRQEASLSAWLVPRLGELGFAAHQDDVGNAIAIKEQFSATGDIDREIMLLGHMDTVPGKIPVRVEEGRLFGRGTVDAKGSLATFIMSAAHVTPSPGTRLVVAAAVEEEVASSKGARAIAKQFSPSVCIIGEPSGWSALTLGYKGCLQLEYQLTQPCSHSAGAGGSAAEAACVWWSQLQQHANQFSLRHERLFDRLLLTLRTMNTTTDGLHDQVIAHVGVRLPPNFECNDYVQQVRAWAQAAKIRAFGYEPAHCTKRSAQIVNVFRRALANRGESMATKVKTGTSDMNVVAPTWQCPIVAYGPGDSQLDHTPHEHIELDEYERSIDVLTEVLRNLSARSDG